MSCMLAEDLHSGPKIQIDSSNLKMCNSHLILQQGIPMHAGARRLPPAAQDESKVAQVWGVGHMRSHAMETRHQHNKRHSKTTKNLLTCRKSMMP